MHWTKAKWLIMQGCKVRREYWDARDHGFMWVWWSAGQIQISTPCEGNVFDPRPEDTEATDWYDCTDAIDERFRANRWNPPLPMAPINLFFHAKAAMDKWYAENSTMEPWEDNISRFDEVSAAFHGIERSVDPNPPDLKTLGADVTRKNIDALIKAVHDDYGGLREEFVSPDHRDHTYCNRQYQKTFLTAHHRLCSITPRWQQKHDRGDHDHGKASQTYVRCFPCHPAVRHRARDGRVHPQGRLQRVGSLRHPVPHHGA